MKLPERPKEHILETASFKIFEQWIPDYWITRQVTERDYGIDAYIELVTVKNQVSGDLISIQIKSASNLKLRTDSDGRKIATSPSIEIPTINYWNQLLIPAFLFVIDVPKKILFFAPVKKQLRQKYIKSQKQKTMTFQLKEHYSSLSEYSLPVFIAEYFYEKNYLMVQNIAMLLFIHWKYYTEYLSGEIGRDCFLPVEEPLVFLQIYKTIREATNIMGLDWKAAEWVDILKYDNTMYGADEILHSGTMEEFVPNIIKMFFIIFEELKRKILHKENHYWKSQHYIIYKKAKELEHINYANYEKYIF
ncbi:MAG: hypothetical protein C0602_06085 [Denitrovibrio sp.]|nr:MAG: hypothetical protein C0602_06085 [Denitrovibrio sp.]